MSETQKNSRGISDEQQLNVSASRGFRTLITPSEIQIWWNARSVVVIPQTDGVWCASWGKDEDMPDYVMAARISEYQADKRLVLNDFRYFSRSGPRPDSKNLQTEFSVSDLSNEPASCVLKVFQTGFPPAGDPQTDEFFKGCVTGWRTTLQAISDYFHVD